MHAPAIEFRKPHLDSGISEPEGWNHIKQSNLVRFFVAQLRVLEDSALQKLRRQAPTEKAGAPGNQNLHYSSLSHPRPSSVRPRGLYSQPT